MRKTRPEPDDGAPPALDPWAMAIHRRRDLEHQQAA
jgi:hypothetical protein